MDDSYLDSKYFIDEYVYNCPFCNRRNVSYFVSNVRNEFDWTPEKKCYVYFVVCDSCGKESMHLSFEKIPISVITSPTSRKLKFRIDNGEELVSRQVSSVIASEAKQSPTTGSQFGHHPRDCHDLWLHNDGDLCVIVSLTGH
ncbi:MAG: hypothetical protein KAH35_07380 [Candidatus Atribacteria bacterium]|nr:hypothetical protein [Candidatus Atribacteria bacterium]